MFSNFPKSTLDSLDWGWEKFEPYYTDLLSRTLDPVTMEAWMLDWSNLEKLAGEISNRIEIATMVDTSDENAKEKHTAFLENILPNMTTHSQKVKEKFLASELEPPNFEVPLKKIRIETDLFNEENVPLLSEEEKLNNKYFGITGSMTVEWDGEEIPLQKLAPILEEPDRERREKAWRLRYTRFAEDQDKFAEVWKEMMDLRGQIAKNAGMNNYRDYRWKQYKRTDYSPDLNKQFHTAVKKVVVPALKRLNKKRKEYLGVDTLRPWDIAVDMFNRPQLKPFVDVEELTNKFSAIFHKIDPYLAQYYDTLKNEGMLDLGSRKNKAPGGFHSSFKIAERSFIFMNTTGTHANVNTLAHEAGHAFHAHEMNQNLSHVYQTDIGMEIAEVASMAMELLAAPYYTKDQGGFYTKEEAARARVKHIERILTVLVMVSMADEHQHWIYENHIEATDITNVNKKSSELNKIYDIGFDWSGLEEQSITGWHQILHYFVVPFYMIEYGFAQMAAVQIWENSIKDASQALTDYKKTLALGGTKTLPELYKAANASFAFEVDDFKSAIGLIEKTIEALEKDLE